MRGCMYAIISLAFILLSIVFTFRIAGEKQRSLMKGYCFSFNEPRGCGPPPPAQLIRSRYHFTDNPLHNDSLMSTLEQDLGLMGRRTNDSLHGVDITFPDDIPYTYYLETIALCHTYPPKEIQAYGNRIYVRGLSRYELWQDSVHEAELKRYGVPELYMTYH